MNNIFNKLSSKSASMLGLALVLSLSLTSCYDDIDDPDTSDFVHKIQSSDTLWTVNTTIKDIKYKYGSNNGKVERPAPWTNDSIHYSRNTSNWETKITEDLVFEGVIAANDGQFGTLYQMLLVRSIDSISTPGTKIDHAIDVEVKFTCLYPLYRVGQRVRINLNGLYAGAYSRVPRIGFPYYTSSGNHNLGPIPMDIFSKHIQFIGDPDPTCAECQPIDRTGSEGDAWMRATANRQTVEFYPTIATIQGIFTEADGTAILAPDNLEDAGYGVNRTLKLLSNTSTVYVRTSTGNELSNIVLPVGDTVQLTGLFSYDSFDDKWQINLRDTSDFKIIHQ